ncbi:MAG: TetR/AcrR family transcriptional regulator [Rhodobacteraceae bacterium]|nr:TetR/AcrR family transcriptional regulator [Paracoccaceae bacterium]
MKKKLSRLDWIQTGFRALTQQGPSTLKAEPLAKSLKVSKGSFYWHFKDIEDFKSAMIQHWQRAATADIIIQIEAGTSNPKQKLHHLAHASTKLPDTRYGGSASESAIRDWARYEPSIANAVSEVDLKRLVFTASLFESCGQKKTQASQSARLLYSALIGLKTLQKQGLPDPKNDLVYLLEALLKPRVAPSVPDSAPPDAPIRR